MTVSFFGHSDYIPSKKDGEKVYNLLCELVGDAPCEFLLGGYGKFDAFAKNCCLEYKKTHKNAKLTLVIPYLNREYDEDGYDGTVYPPIEKVPFSVAISRRNEWMVNNSDHIIAYVYHYGGARNTLRIAERKKKPIYNLAIDKYPDFTI